MAFESVEIERSLDIDVDGYSVFIKKDIILNVNVSCMNCGNDCVFEVNVDNDGDLDIIAICENCTKK